MRRGLYTAPAWHLITSQDNPKTMFSKMDNVRQRPDLKDRRSVEVRQSVYWDGNVNTWTCAYSAQRSILACESEASQVP